MNKDQTVKAGDVVAMPAAIRSQLPQTGTGCYLEPGHPMGGIGKVVTSWTPGTTDEQKLAYCEKHGYVDADELTPSTPGTSQTSGGS